MPNDRDPEWLVIHAPGIHVGGGKVLLNALLAASDFPFKMVGIDSRLNLTNSNIKVKFIKPSVVSRLFAEFRLWRTVEPNDKVLCFNGLPPLFPLSGHVVVFFQNRLLLKGHKLSHYAIKTKIRLLFERLWLRFFKRHAQNYIVQTQTMAAALEGVLGHNFKITIKPFAPLNKSYSIFVSKFEKFNFDFVYVADGEPHKNHAVLLCAWRLLADSGLRPSLALTVDPNRHPLVAAEIATAVTEQGLNIVNFGQLAEDEVSCIYQRSLALIYPSLAESFGLPLIEAKRSGLEILASELDYVRDIVEPIQTFDPHSPLSLSRAVRRFLGEDEPPAPICSGNDFLAEVFR